MYGLFGVHALDLEEAAKLVNQELKILLVPRESGMIGDYYKIGMGYEETLELRFKVGYDQDEEYATEPNYPDWNVFAYISNATPTSAYLAALRSNPKIFTELWLKEG